MMSYLHIPDALPYKGGVGGELSEFQPHQTSPLISGGSNNTKFDRFFVIINNDADKESWRSPFFNADLDSFICHSFSFCSEWQMLSCLYRSNVPDEKAAQNKHVLS